MPMIRFLPERTDFFVPFRTAATNAAEAARLLTDLVTGQELSRAGRPAIAGAGAAGRRDHARDLHRPRAQSHCADQLRGHPGLRTSSTTSPTRSTPSASGWRVSPASRDRGGATADAHHPGAGGEPAAAVTAHRAWEASRRAGTPCGRDPSPGDRGGLGAAPRARRLYDGVTAIPALVHAMGWGELYGLLEDTTDRAETVANTLQGIMEQQV